MMDMAFFLHVAAIRSRLQKQITDVSSLDPPALLDNVYPWTTIALQIPAVSPAHACIEFHHTHIYT